MDRTRRPGAGGTAGGDPDGPGKGVAAIAAYLAGSTRTLERRRRRVDEWLDRLDDGSDAGEAPRAPLVVGIDGRSGSGKTLLAHALAVELRAAPEATSTEATSTEATSTEPGPAAPGGIDDVVVVGLDRLYHGWDGLQAGLETARDLLTPLTLGRPGRAPLWDWHAGHHDGELVIGTEAALPRVVVVEGCGAGSDTLADLVDMLVWVEVPEPTRRARARARDGVWDYPWEAWAAQEDAVLARRDAAEAADLVVGTAPRISR